MIALVLTTLPTSADPWYDDDPVRHDPIYIGGDAEMDEFFNGSSADGLSWETAYVVENLHIEAGTTGAAIQIDDTSRYVVVRDCKLSGGVSDETEGTLHIRFSKNIRIEGCSLVDSRRAVRLWQSEGITLVNNRITNQSSHGVLMSQCENVTIEGNHFSNSGIALYSQHSKNVTLASNEALENTIGILIDGSEGCNVIDNKVSLNIEGGVELKGARDTLLADNQVLNNWVNGIVIRRSDGTRVIENTVFDNSRGIVTYSSSEVEIRGNNITKNDYLGIRLSDSDGSVIDGNEVRANEVIGVELVRSDDNEITGNDIFSHTRAGISITDSTGNLIEGNRIYNNWWVGIEGDTSGNTIRDNDLRANAWVKGILFLVVGLVALGSLYASIGWWRRRRQGRDEKGKILVKHRFPPGGKGLWAISKWLWDEDFFRAQLDSAGPQREMILERYQSNIAAAKQMQYMAVGTMAVMLAFMVVLPLVGVFNVVVTDVTEDNVNDALFATGISLGFYFLLSFVILLVFGLLFLAQLMKGDIFQLLATLPIQRRSSRRIILYMMLRMYGAPFVVVLFAFPIGGFIISWSIPFFLVALLVNAVYLAFVSFLLIIISDQISRRVFSASATRGATVMRFVVIGGYLIAMMTVFVAIQFVSAFIADLYESATLAGESGEMINSFVALVPFPFSGGYLVSMSLIPGSALPAPVVATTLGGLTLLVGAVYAMRRVSNRILDRVSMDQEIGAVGSGHLATAEDIHVLPLPTIRAHSRFNLLVTSRDMGSIIYLVMPIVFPFIIIMTMVMDPDIGTFEPLFPYVMYLGITPFLLNMALSTGDASVGGLLASLPFRVHDQFRAKQLNMMVFMLAPLVVITVLMSPRVAEPEPFLTLMVSLVPLDLVLVSLYLVTFSLAFGSVNRRYTFFMSNIRFKLAKYIGIIALQYGLVAVELGAFWFLYSGGVVSFEAGIASLWGTNLALVIVLELMARRLFR